MPYDVLPLVGPGTTGRPSTAARPSTLRDLTLRDLMREVAQPVAVVSGTADGDPTPLAMTVSSVTSVSLDPPLLLFCPSRQSRTWAALAPTGRFVLNVLGEHQREVADWFGGRAGVFSQPVARHDCCPPTAVRWTSLGGLPALVCSAATAMCHVVSIHPGGDHDIVVAEVDHVVVARLDEPVVAEVDRMVGADEVVFATGRSGPLSYWRGRYATVRAVGRGPSC
ncbi:MAG TPA: flavin reductase family protein [Nocardioidaceae bacterium]